MSKFPILDIFHEYFNLQIYEGDLSDEEAVRKWAMDEETLQIDGQVRSTAVKEDVPLVKRPSLFFIIQHASLFIE